MKPTDTMTDDTKPESASERDEKLAQEYAFEEIQQPDGSIGRCPDCAKAGFIVGRQSMREETKNKTEWGQLRSVIDRQEKTILELRAALEFYADPRNYIEGIPGSYERTGYLGETEEFEEDNGIRARGVLARTENP